MKNIFGKIRKKESEPVRQSNQSWTHVVIIDGTLSQLDEGKTTHCGTLFKLLKSDHRARQKIYYDPGVQGTGLTKWLQVASGKGINRSIRNCYRLLSENYRPGDQIFLFGYSRGAYAVRLLAGVINAYGLLLPRYATSKKVSEVIELFAQHPPRSKRKAFISQFCFDDVAVEFIGVWDTVKALGLPLPFLRNFTPMVLNFHDRKVPDCVKKARQALAFHETRRIFEPIFWTSRSPQTDLVQMVFPGSHAIIGGQISHHPEALELSNLSLNWMLNEAQMSGLWLPEDWRGKFPIDEKLITDTHANRWYWLKEPRKFTPNELFEYHGSLQSLKLDVAWGTQSIFVED